MARPDCRVSRDKHVSHSSPTPDRIGLRGVPYRAAWVPHWNPEHSRKAPGMRDGAACLVGARAPQRDQLLKQGGVPHAQGLHPHRNGEKNAKPELHPLSGPERKKARRLARRVVLADQGPERERKHTAMHQVARRVRLGSILEAR